MTRHRRSIVRVATLVLAGLMAASPAEPCTCITPGPACQEFWPATAVFVGRVESVARIPVADYELVSFTVLEPFKGVRAGPVRVRTAAGGCGRSFRAGRQYLVYASAVDGSSELATGACSRTQPIERAARDLQYVRSLSSNLSTTGEIAGRVLLRTRDLARRRDRDRPVPGVVVSLTSGEAITRIATDGVGRFAARGMPPGRYLAALEPTPGVSGSIVPGAFELPDARACVQLSAVLRPTTSVRGRVVDGSGRPVPGLTVDLTVPTGLDRNPGPERIRGLTHADGSFELIGVPPGRFVLGVNTMPGRTPRLMYPGVGSLSEATVVAVRAGVDVDVHDFVIPAPISFAQIPGVVLDSSGAPAEGARVFLAGPQDGDPILGEPATTDELGRFVLSASSGQQYRIFAERVRDSHTNRVDASDVIVFNASTTRVVQKLTLRSRY
jgi:hypothetical protein